MNIISKTRKKIRLIPSSKMHKIELKVVRIYKKEVTVRISDIPEIAKLSAQEKILLVEDIWDSIALDESVVPIPRCHRDKLDKRLRIHESPGNLLTLEELQARIEKRK